MKATELTINEPGINYASNHLSVHIDHRFSPSGRMAIGAFALDPSRAGERRRTGGAVHLRRMVTEVRTTTLTESVTYTEFEPSPSGPVLVERTDEVTTEVEYNVQIPLLETRVERVTLDKVKAFELSGKRLTSEQLKERTKVPTVVAISPYKRSVADLAFLSVLKPDTLNLVINAELKALGYQVKRDDSGEIPAPPLPTEVEPPAPPAN